MIESFSHSMLPKTEAHFNSLFTKSNFFARHFLLSLCHFVINGLLRFNTITVTMQNPFKIHSVDRISKKNHAAKKLLYTQRQFWNVQQSLFLIIRIISCNCRSLRLSSDQAYLHEPFSLTVDVDDT